MNATPSTPTSFAWTPSPQDRRCSFWAKALPITKAILPADTEGANSIPAPYLKRGEEIELFDWDIVMYGEANHHRKQRGWTFNTLVALDGRLVELTSTSCINGAIRKISPGNQILRGAGDHAAMMRAARFLTEASDEADRHFRLLAISYNWNDSEFIIPVKFRDVLADRIVSFYGLEDGIDSDNVDALDLLPAQISSSICIKHIATNPTHKLISELQRHVAADSQASTADTVTAVVA